MSGQITTHLEQKFIYLNSTFASCGKVYTETTFLLLVESSPLAYLAA